MIPCATCLMLGYACRVYGSHRVYILCGKPKGIRTGREGPASLQSCQTDIPSPHLRTFRLVPYYHTKQRVVDLSGTNTDGEKLVEGYDYSGKDRYEVADDLADLAVEREFLKEGGQITLTAGNGSAQWREDTEQGMRNELEEHLKDYDIRIVISTDPEEEMIQEETESVTIPVPQQEQPVQEDAGNVQDAQTTPAAPAAETPQTVQPQTPDDDGDSGYGDDDDGDDGDDGEDD